MKSIIVHYTTTVRQPVLDNKTFWYNGQPAEQVRRLLLLWLGSVEGLSFVSTPFSLEEELKIQRQESGAWSFTNGAFTATIRDREAALRCFAYAAIPLEVPLLNAEADEEHIAAHTISGLPVLPEIASIPFRDLKPLTDEEIAGRWMLSLEWRDVDGPDPDDVFVGIVVRHPDEEETFYWLGGRQWIRPGRFTILNRFPAVGDPALVESAANDRLLATFKRFPVRPSLHVKDDDAVLIGRHPVTWRSGTGGTFASICNGWVAPYGDFYACGEHHGWRTAEHIAGAIYGVLDAEEALLERGWAQIHTLAPEPIQARQPLTGDQRLTIRRMAAGQGSDVWAIALAQAVRQWDSPEDAYAAAVRDYGYVPDEHLGGAVDLIDTTTGQAYSVYYRNLSPEEIFRGVDVDSEDSVLQAMLDNGQFVTVSIAGIDSFDEDEQPGLRAHDGFLGDEHITPTAVLLVAWEQFMIHHQRQQLGDHA